VLHGDHKPPSVFLVAALVLGRWICIVGECLRGCGGTAPFHHPAQRTTWRTEPVAELRPCRGVALLGGDIPSTGLSVRDQCDPIPLPLNVQGLTLGGPGYLGLGRGLLGLERVVDFDGLLIYVLGENVRGNRRSPRGYFCQLICGFVVPSSDMVEFQPVELIFQAPNFVAVGLHFSIVAVGVLLDLVNDELRVATSVEAPNP
jgi:hypothetical protein